MAHQHRASAGFGDPVGDGVDQADGVGVEAGMGFVQQQQSGGMPSYSAAGEPSPAT